MRARRDAVSQCASAIARRGASPGVAATATSSAELSAHGDAAPGLSRGTSSAPRAGSEASRLSVEARTLASRHVSVGNAAGPRAVARVA